jgi:hypothetical protein
MNEHQSLAIHALEQMKADSSDRAKQGLEALKEMGLLTNRTRSLCVDGYEAYVARIDAAIEWVKGQKV